MKVYGTTAYFDGKGRQCRVVIAAKTKTQAAKAFGLTMYSFNLHAAETGNVTEITKALEKPGQVIVVDKFK